MNNTIPSVARVLIIRGGIGGLSTAQGLKNRGISAHIFERDDSLAFRSQGYRIRISAEGGAALKTLLSEELWTSFEHSCAEVVERMTEIDAVSGESKVPSRGPPRGPQGKQWNADRAVLRTLLLSGLEDCVSFGKTFERYETINDKIIAHFCDGSVEQGSMLIGADGVHSVIRRQLAPEHRLFDSDGRAIFGKTPVTSSLFQTLPEVAQQGIVLAQDKSDACPATLFFESMKFPNHSDFKDRLPSDYVYWVLVFQQHVLTMADSRFPKLSTQAAAELALKLSSGWHGNVRCILEAQDTQATATFQILTSDPKNLPTSAQGRVILLGDASHPMPPVAGLGANTALQDAATLVQIISNSTLSAKDLRRYNAELGERASGAILGSFNGGRRIFGMKPFKELTPV